MLGPNKKHTIERIVIYILVLLLVFNVGFFAGKRVERKVTNDKIGELADAGEGQLPDKLQKPTEESKESIEIAQSSEEPTEVESTVSANDVYTDPKLLPQWNPSYADPEKSVSLATRAKNQSAYDELMQVNAKDKEIIANNEIDFSNMKITCLGDSITMGVKNSIPYPVYLQEALKAKEVVNLGMGGSTVASSSGAYPMVYRVEEIPEDTDLIIVLGGTNDSFYQADYQFGFMDWETKGEGTFCGDLQLLMRRCEWFFEDTPVIFMTPPSTAKWDEMKSNNDRLLDQSKYAEAINLIGAEEGISVIDLYNQNFLNSHDSNILAQYMCDTVHPNSEGNRLLAEHVAAEIIKRFTPQ